MRSYEQKKKEKPSSNAFFSPKIQKKLKTGTVGDRYEVEADKVADKVVNKTAPQNGLIQSKSEEEVQQKAISGTISSVQKQEMKEEETVQKKSDEKEDKVQKKETKEEEPVQKKEEEEMQKKEMKEEEPLQKKEEEEVQKKEMKEEEPVQKKEEEEVQKKETVVAEKSEMESRLRKTKGNGSPMSKGIKLEMENSFGADFSSIRIHTDSNAVSMCQEMKAQAFTNGSDIYFNKGKYNPNSAAGKQLLAHELTHTIQQGAVSVTKKRGSL
jgi:flagellar biosynthesis GTPase FlhF